MPRKKHVSKSIEEIYCNKRFVPPKEKNLETIFEEPRQSKDGAPILTSVKKYKRYLHFDPSQNKIQKRKQKAKKCIKKLKLNDRVTRSSPECSKPDDISMYILDILDDSSNDSNMNVSVTSKISADITEKTSGFSTNSANSERNESLNDICETPKRTVIERRPSMLLQRDEDLLNTTHEIDGSNYMEKSENPSQINTEKSSSENGTETMESPRSDPYG